MKHPAAKQAAPVPAGLPVELLPNEYANQDGGRTIRRSLTKNR